MFARLGGRTNYKIVPGLYCVGTPNAGSEVLVTCNYKLTVDALRHDIEGVNAWILILDTHGINVWCAAGKKTFSTVEIIHRVAMSELKCIAPEATLILPQLAATGVNAREVRKKTGFPTIFGPILSKDIPQFLANNLQADTAMRRVTFNMSERAVLIPVEITLLWKPIIIGLVLMLLVSGISPSIFSFHAALTRGYAAFLAGVAGIVAGTVIVPLFLPWLPGRAFSIKGALTGFGTGTIAAFMGDSFLAGSALVLFSTAISTYLAMNFTGSTPFTSPSGVEKEMRYALPWIAGGFVLSVLLWIISGLSA